jgi:hypothetical protein
MQNYAFIAWGMLGKEMIYHEHFVLGLSGEKPNLIKDEHFWFS